MGLSFLLISFHDFYRLLILQISVVFENQISGHQQNGSNHAVTVVLFTPFLHQGDQFWWEEQK